MGTSKNPTLEGFSHLCMHTREPSLKFLNNLRFPYGVNYYTNWETSNTLGVSWYENKDAPGGAVSHGDHNTQHITANRKAFAMWWILARIAGWDGTLED